MNIIKRFFRWLFRIKPTEVIVIHWGDGDMDNIKSYKKIKHAYQIEEESK